MEKIIKIFMIIILINTKELKATTDTFDLANKTTFLPNMKKCWTYHHSLNATFLYLPNIWLEETVSAPMAYYRSLFYMPYNIVAHADVKTIVVSNEVRVGLAYHHTFNNKWYSAIGYQFGYNFGILNRFGYNDNIKVIQHHPFIELGYKVKDLTFTLQGKLDYTSKVYYSIGDIENTSNIKSLNGYTIGLIMEQRVFKNKTMAIGFNANVMQFHILGWPAFNTIKQRFFIPEITFGFKL